MRGLKFRRFRGLTALTAHWTLIFLGWLVLGALGMRHSFGVQNFLILLAVWWPASNLSSQLVKKTWSARTLVMTFVVAVCALMISFRFTLAALDRLWLELSAMACALCWAIATGASLQLTRRIARQDIWGERAFALPLGAWLAWVVAGQMTHSISGGQGMTRLFATLILITVALWSWSQSTNKDLSPCVMPVPVEMPKSPIRTELPWDAIAVPASHLSMVMMMASLVYVGQWCSDQSMNYLLPIDLIHVSLMGLMPLALKLSRADQWVYDRNLQGKIGCVLLIVGGLTIVMMPDPRGLMLCMLSQTLAWTFGLRPQRPVACAFQSPSSVHPFGPDWVWAILGGGLLWFIGSMALHDGPVVLLVAHGLIAGTTLFALISAGVIRVMRAPAAIR